MDIVTFTSDLGYTDFYTGVIKGALLTRNPNLQIIDISHNIKRYDIVQAAFVLKNAYSAFPPGTIHLVSVHNNHNYQSSYVVFQQDGHFFAGPNNGLFSLIFNPLPKQIYEISHAGGGSFPTPEIYSKVVDHISKKGKLEALGEPAKNLVVRLSLQPVINKSQIRGSVIHIDRYENVIVNITRDLFEQVKQERSFAIFFKRHDPIVELSNQYGDVPVGETLCLFNSTGYLEIAINMDKAASLLGLKVDETIQIDFYDNED
jgi:S-adenosylmethionine hydrolase